jgi:hypothetical protein
MLYFRKAGERDWLSTKLSLILRMFNYFQNKGKAPIEGEKTLKKVN